MVINKKENITEEGVEIEFEEKVKKDRRKKEEKIVANEKKNEWKWEWRKKVKEGRRRQLCKFKNEFATVPNCSRKLGKN